MTTRTRRRTTVSAVAIGALAAVVGAQSLPDLGVPESEAREQTIQVVLNGSIPLLGAAVFKAASPAGRVALVQGIVAWAKVFTKSPAFRTAYTTARRQSRPEPPPIQASSADPIAEQRAEFEKSAAEMRKAMAGQSAEMRKTVEDNIKQMREQLDEMAKDTDMVKAMRGAAAAQRAEEQNRYARSVKEFDATHPTDPRAALVPVLQRFLDLSGTVDFDAKLVRSPNGKMVFENPDYESRPGEWKMCFRAGREPVMAARAAVQAWLQEIRR